MGSNDVYITTNSNVIFLLNSQEFDCLAIEIGKDKIISRDVGYTTEMLDAIVENDPSGKTQLVLSVKGYDDIDLPLYSIREVNEYLSSVFNASPVGISRFEPYSLQLFLINESLENIDDVANPSLSESKLRKALLKIMVHLGTEEKVDAFMSNVRQALKV